MTTPGEEPESTPGTAEAGRWVRWGRWVKRKPRVILVVTGVLAVWGLIAWATSAPGGDGREASSTTIQPSAVPPVAPDGVDLRTLVIAGDETEPEFRLATDVLEQSGIPFETVVVGRATPTEPEFASLLSDRPDHARFNSVVLTNGDLVAGAQRPGASSRRLPASWIEALRTFEVAFHVRSVTLNAYPVPDAGFSYDGYLDAASSSVDASYTADGASVFDTANPGRPLPVRNTGVYLATAVDAASTTPLLTVVGPDGRVHPIAATVRSTDGRERLVIMTGNGPEMIHSLVMSYGWIEWMTRGLHLGRRQPSLDVQVDDLFLTVALWDPSEDRVGTAAFRNDAADIDAAASWLRRRREAPTTKGLSLDFAFVGSGTEPNRHPNDELLPAVLRHRDVLRFINHTYSHYDLDCGAKASCGGKFEATADAISTEIRRNIDRGKELGLSSDWETMVQPDVSGVNNTPGSNAQAAAADAGIRFWISDTSRPGGNNPRFNVGIDLKKDARIHVVPRHPTNLFYDDSTPDEWVDEFNHTYGPGGTLCDSTTCFDTPQTLTQIIDRESDVLLRYLLRGDTDPLMFHTPNARAYDGEHSLLTDLLGATLDKYDALMTTPISMPTFRQVGLSEKARADVFSADVVATSVACDRLVLSAVRDAEVPVTGATTRTASIRGGRSASIAASGC